MRQIERLTLDHLLMQERNYPRDEGMTYQLPDLKSLLNAQKYAVSLSFRANIPENVGIRTSTNADERTITVTFFDKQ